MAIAAEPMTNEGAEKFVPDWAKLTEKFSSKNIEWRAGRCGVKNGRKWVMCLAYVTNRAIQDRLDSVLGPANWANEYRQGPDGGVICGISIRVAGEWITKWDGAQNTEIESVKGGLSGSMKRAAVQWGIGRYLYGLEENFATILEVRGGHKDVQTAVAKVKENGREQKVFILWKPPQLPDWALPEGETDTGAARTIDFEPEAGPPAHVVDSEIGPKDGSAKANGSAKPNGHSAAAPVSQDQQLAWVDDIEAADSFDSLVNIERTVIDPAKSIDDAARQQLYRSIAMRAKSLGATAGREKQNKMLNRIGMFADRTSWMTSEQGKTFQDILRSAWNI